MLAGFLGKTGYASSAEPTQQLAYRQWWPFALVNCAECARPTRAGGLGVSPRTAMEIVGHTTLEMTMNVYAHVTLNDKRGALSRFDELFEKGEK